MKKYQLNFFMLFVLSLSLFLGSCSKDTLNESKEATVTKSDLKDATITSLTSLVLPKGQGPRSQEEFETFWQDQQLSEEQIALYKENSRILDYLESFGVSEQVLDAMKDGESIAEVDLASFLSEEQLVKIATNEPLAASRATCWVEVFRCVICNSQGEIENHIWNCCLVGGTCPPGATLRLWIQSTDLPCSPPNSTLWCTG